MPTSKPYSELYELLQKEGYNAKLLTYVGNSWKTTTGIEVYCEAMLMNDRVSDLRELLNDNTLSILGFPNEEFITIKYKSE